MLSSPPLPPSQVTGSDHVLPSERPCEGAALPAPSHGMTDDHSPGGQRGRPHEPEPPSKAPSQPLEAAGYLLFRTPHFGVNCCTINWSSDKWVGGDARLQAGTVFLQTQVYCLPTPHSLCLCSGKEELQDPKQGPWGLVSHNQQLTCWEQEPGF